MSLFSKAYFFALFRRNKSFFLRLIIFIQHLAASYSINYTVESFSLYILHITFLHIIATTPLAIPFKFVTPLTAVKSQHDH